MAQLVQHDACNAQGCGFNSMKMYALITLKLLRIREAAKMYILNGEFYLFCSELLFKGTPRESEENVLEQD